MAKDMVRPSGVGGGTREVIEPSFRNALLYSMNLAIFPLVINAAVQGGWWILAPLIFFQFPDWLDTRFGTEERNMDPARTLDRQLFWYKLAVWLWAVLWVGTLVFSLWQVLVVGHLSTWEVVAMAFVLGMVAQPCFIVGHELIHSRAAPERRLGEFLLACVSYPTYATEHIYIHHALVCTPGDPGSPPKGVSFWQYLPGEVKNNILAAWRFERDRLARRHLPVWHYTNPFWRYVFETAAWYAFAYWVGGLWVALTYAVICAGVVFSMKIINYVQHYGLRRIRMPNGRYEKVRACHSWSAAYKLSNLFFYNMQRHPDHHIAPTRRYPLLQHCGEDEAPQLPGSYMQMGGMALFPRRWFETMDPLVDQWRAHFYPEIEDWSAYDSRAAAARPDSFETIAEIIGAAPRLAQWINRSPELLDVLDSREFTDLDLPRGFGPDTESEAIARRGLSRLYWTRELGVAEMTEQIAELPFLGAAEAVDTVRNWSNDKAFQIGMHTLRGNLSPAEAGIALSNVAEASIATVLSAVEEEFAGRGAEGGMAAVLLGDLASRETAPGADIELVLVYDGDPEHHEAMGRRFLGALRDLSGDNLLFAPASPRATRGRVRSLAEFTGDRGTGIAAGELLELTRARCAYTAGDPGIEGRFDEARREVLARGGARGPLMAELRHWSGEPAEPGPLAIDGMLGGARDVERAARLVQLAHVDEGLDSPAPDAASVFRSAGERGWIPGDTAGRLAEAADTWRSLRGILRLVAEEGFTLETAGASVKAVIARGSGASDFDVLSATIPETASRAAADIDAIEDMNPDGRSSA